MFVKCIKFSDGFKYYRNEIQSKQILIILILEPQWIRQTLTYHFCFLSSVINAICHFQIYMKSHKLEKII